MDETEKMLKRRGKLFARLDRLNQDRKSEIEQKHSNHKQNIDPNETVPTFMKTFDAKKSEIRSLLESIIEIKESDRIDVFKRISEELATLQQFISSGTLFLPSRVISRAHQDLSDLQESMNSKRSEYMPRKKFEFSQPTANSTSSTGVSSPKDRNTEQCLKENRTGKSCSHVSAELLEKLKLESDETKIHNLTLQTIYFGPSEIRGGSVWISNINSCTINICDRIGSLRIDNVSNCKIYIGPVAGSVHVEQSERCTFMLASRQIRIHKSKFCDFYLHVQSEPIIEHSTDLRFSYYSFVYDDLQRHFKEAGLEYSCNRWEEVKDFNWLRSQHSPNWCHIKEKERINEMQPVLPEEEEDEF